MLALSDRHGEEVVIHVRQELVSPMVGTISGICPTCDGVIATPEALCVALEFSARVTLRFHESCYTTFSKWLGTFTSTLSEGSDDQPTH
jgi:hypothetical protein